MSRFGTGPIEANLRFALPRQIEFWIVELPDKKLTVQLATESGVTDPPGIVRHGFFYPDSPEHGPMSRIIQGLASEVAYGLPHSHWENEALALAQTVARAFSALPRR
jgi:hypothetical protein